MFKRLFQKKKSDGLSKLDYFRKWELNELFDDLDAAKQFLNETKQQESNIEFANFKKDFTEELYETKGDNVADFTRIWEWFTPGAHWNSITGSAGKELGDQIFKRADRWKRNHDFVPGTKVSLNNEYGIVLNKVNESGLYGLILWDTDKENDIEDWAGLFGSFLQAGGQIIEQDHEFKFINSSACTDTLPH